MIRRAVKSAGAQALHLLGADRWIGAAAGRARPPLIVCYHRVVEDVRRHPLAAPAMLVSLATLERQLDWIGRRFDFVGLDELARGLETGRRRPRPAAAVTFDDGYADVYHHGFPLLRRKGIPFAVFVVTDLEGTDRLQLHDELYVLLKSAAARLGPADLDALLRDFGVAAGAALRSGSPRLVELTEHLLVTHPRGEIVRLAEELGREVALPDPVRDELAAMSWEMVAELHREGVTVGSHTRGHRVLPNEPAAVVEDELAGSKRRLEEELGAPVRHLAYPAGGFDRSTVDAAEAAGYRFAYTTCHHRSPRRPLLTLPRRTFWERSSAGLFAGFSPAVASCQVEGVFDGLATCGAGHRLVPAAGAARRQAAEAAAP